jgi:hypothetical protein
MYDEQHVINGKHLPSYIHSLSSCTHQPPTPIAHTTSSGSSDTPPCQHSPAPAVERSLLTCWPTPQDANYSSTMVSVRTAVQLHSCLPPARPRSRTSSGQHLSRPNTSVVDGHTCGGLRAGETRGVQVGWPPGMATSEGRSIRYWSGTGSGHVKQVSWIWATNGEV